MALHVISQSTQLYDMAYVGGGCKGDPPLGPSGTGTNMDDTPGCYLTNYAILAVGVIGVILMMMNTKAGPTYKAFASVFFTFTGAGYGLAGWLHQTTTSQAVNDFVGVGPVSASISLSNAGTLGLVLIGVQLLIDKYSISCGWLLYSIAAIVNGGAVVYEFFALPSYFLLSGAVHIVGALFVTVVYSLLCKFPQAISVLVMALGFVVQGALAPTCGGSAYYWNCWKDCILPAPHFNHNALFHTMVAVGMLTLLIFMNNSPDMTEDDEKKGNDFTKVADEA